MKEDQSQAISTLTKNYLAKFGIEAKNYPIQISQGIQQLKWYEQV